MTWIAQSDPITEVTLTNLTYPKAGEKAQMSGFGVPSGAHYTVQPSDIDRIWTNKDDAVWMGAEDTFEARKTYELYVAFIAEDKYSFSEETEIIPTIEGLTDTDYYVSYVAVRESAHRLAVNFQITVREEGEFIVTFDSGESGVWLYSEGMCTVSHKLPLEYLPYAKKEGYVLEGWYTAKMGGEKVTVDKVYEKNTRIYARYIPEEEATTISSANCIVTEPVAGKQPSYEVETETEGYYAIVVSWYCYDSSGNHKMTDTEVFKQENTYKVSLFIAPKNKYLFSEDAVININGDETYKSGIYYSLSFYPMAKITFDANGGTVSPGYANTEKMRLTELPTPVRDGWNFMGWYSAMSDGVIITQETKFTEATTIYAHWTKDIPVESVNVSFELPKPGQKIENETNCTYSPSGSLEVDEGRLQARWLVYYVKGSYYDLPSSSDTFEAGRTYYLHVPMVAKPGYFIRPDRIKDIVKFNNLPPNNFDRVNSYGDSWVYEYTISDEMYITLDPNGGQVVNETYLTVNWLIPKLPDATRAEYDFVGWFTEKEGGTKIEKGVELSSKIKLYARWKEREKTPAEKVIEKINAIGTLTFDEECHTRIMDAADDYALLTNAQKALVTNYSVLENAQQWWNEQNAAVQDTLVVKTVIDKISAIGTVTNDMDCYNRIQDAMLAYEALTVKQKDLVTNFKVLEDALEMFKLWMMAGTTPAPGGTPTPVATTTPGSTTTPSSTTNPSSTTTPSATPTTPQVGTILKDDLSAAEYKVLTKGSGNATVEYLHATNNKAIKIGIPATIQVEGVVYKVTRVAGNAFKNKKKVKTVTIGKNVTAIGDKAFYKCLSLSKITIPAKVKSIGKSAFEGCKKLKIITITSTQIKTVGKKAIGGIFKKAVIKVPKKKYKQYKKIFKASTGYKKTMKISK